MEFKKILLTIFFSWNSVYSSDALPSRSDGTFERNHTISSPYNNNQQRIDINSRTGRATRTSDGTKRVEDVQDSVFGQWQKTVVQGNPRGSTITLVNNNEHVIVQHNNQVQTMPVMEKPKSEIGQLIANPSWYALLATTLKENKNSIIVGAIGLSWAAVTAKLLYSSYSIANYDGWGTWYSHVAIENVYQTEQAAFAQKVFAEIQRRYQIQSNNFLSPLIHFMNDVDAEILFLKNFLQIHQTLSVIKLSMLFPSQSDVQATAMQRIARLEFLKNLVITFAAEYKVN